LSNNLECVISDGQKKQGQAQMNGRRIEMDGAVNFRDIGGYAAGPGRQTRWGRIYRSDSLAELTAADLDRITQLGLFGISDFRLASERMAKPDRLPDGHAMRLLTPGFIPVGTEDMIRGIEGGAIGAVEIATAVLGHYRLFVTDHLDNYISTLRMMLEAEGRPVLLHCTSGKDRTGFGIALTLLAAGCSEETVVDDYILTNDYRRDVRFLFRNGVDPAALDMLTMARAEYLEMSLATLRERHGGPDDWLAAMGFDHAERLQLRDLLSEPVSS
jgi:protein-tyrosine phosphatase